MDLMKKPKKKAQKKNHLKGIYITIGKLNGSFLN